MIAEPKDELRRTTGPLLDALRSAGADTAKPKAIRCPFHEDRHASAGVYPDEDGIWRFKCHGAGCGFSGDVFDVRERSTGQTVADQLRELKEAEEKQPAKSKYRYPSLEVLKQSTKGLTDCF